MWYWIPILSSPAAAPDPRGHIRSVQDVDAHSLRNRKGYLKRKADKRKAAGIDVNITLDDSPNLEEDEEAISDDD